MSTNILPPSRVALLHGRKQRMSGAAAVAVSAGLNELFKQIKDTATPDGMYPFQRKDKVISTQVLTVLLQGDQATIPLSHKLHPVVPFKQKEYGLNYLRKYYNHKLDKDELLREKTHKVSKKKKKVKKVKVVLE